MHFACWFDMELPHIDFVLGNYRLPTQTHNNRNVWGMKLVWVMIYNVYVLNIGRNNSNNASKVSVHFPHQALCEEEEGSHYILSYIA